jgi:hypothetical protein
MKMPTAIQAKIIGVLCILLVVEGIYHLKRWLWDQVIRRA